MKLPETRYKDEIIKDNNCNIKTFNSISSISPQLIKNKNMTIIIKSKNLRDIELQVNSDDYIKDIIKKYKSKLQDDKIINITFKKENGELIIPNHTLFDEGIENKSILYAEYEYDEGNNEEDKNDENKRIETKIENSGLSQEQIKKLKNLMKENLKNGLITILIYNSSLGTEYYHVNPKVNFQIIADQFSNRHPEKKWYYLFDGIKVSQDQTLKELKIKMLSKVLAQELYE